MADTLREETLSSTQLLEGKLLQVYRDEVRVSDGHTSVREWIRHPGASAVVPLFADGSTVLVRQFRYPPQRTFLEVPAGKLDQGSEDPETAAVRELEEETGWRAGRLTALGSLYPCIGYSNEIIHFFLAEDLERGAAAEIPGEVVQNVRMPFAEAVEQALTGGLRDMKTTAALALANAYVQGRR
ncbi:MAG: NUDIX hydrolase [Bacteroidota bacterium]